MQINYVIYLTNVINKTNIIYWVSIKYKWVIHSILLAKLYKIAYGFDIGVIIKATLKKIFEFAILLILYIDSKFFYNCLVKLDSI